MDGLQQLPLRDIHLPDAVSWWPPAYGWWLLPVLLALLLWLLSKGRRRWRRRWHARRLRGAAQRELDAVAERYRASGDARAAVAAVSVLLRRFALSIAPREQVAALTGQGWLEWLRERSRRPVFRDREGPAALLELPYQPDPQLDVAALLAECRTLLDALDDREGHAT